MRYVELPHTSLKVSVIAMGTGELGSSVSAEKSFLLLDKMYELGGTFIDTGKVYGDWVPGIHRSISERVVGGWVRSRGLQGKVVLATKGCISAENCSNDHNCRPETIVRHIEWSLNTLQTNSIDLWYIHKDDGITPIDEMMDCLYEQVKTEKIRYYGASNMSVSRLEQAEDYAIKKGIPNFAVDQSLWNAAVLNKFPYDDPSVSFMNTARYEFHQRTKIAFCAFQATAFGLFHRYQKDTLDQMNLGFKAFYMHEKSRARYMRILEVMRKKDLTLTEVVLGYIYGQKDFTAIPIVGSHKMEQVEENFKSADASITQEEIDYINGDEPFGLESPQIRIF